MWKYIYIETKIFGVVMHANLYGEAYMVHNLMYVMHLIGEYMKHLLALLDYISTHHFI
jgi:hypothetical protein